MTTTYGTISTSDHHHRPPFPFEARQRIGTLRPWKTTIKHLSFPESPSIALQRVRTNASYFQVNYAVIVLLAVFISLLWRPVSLIVFMFAMIAWIFLYFLRHDPIVVFGYGVDERVILTVLSIATVVVLLLTHAVVFLAGIGAGLVVVLVHGAARRVEDLVPDVEECGGGKVVVDLKETASASYSSTSS